MKTLTRTLLLTAMLAVPFAAAQAHDNDAAHRAWLKAQQIDIKPTINIQETQIPAGTSATSGGTGMPEGTNSPSMPSSPTAPSSTMPSSQGTYSPGLQPSGTPSYPAPMENQSGMNSGMGAPAK